MKRLLAVAILLSAILGGCAVYPDGDRHYYGGDGHWEHHYDGDRYGGFEGHGS
jgi:hypothetical protein